MKKQYMFSVGRPMVASELVVRKHNTAGGPRRATSKAS